jgi:membrane-bound ClpP family serine protease
MKSILKENLPIFLIIIGCILLIATMVVPLIVIGGLILIFLAAFLGFKLLAQRK